MFYDQTGGQNIVTDYINNRQETDTLTACRAVVKQCFDNFGGSGYENFYYPYSGLFKTGEALDWFTLYEYDENGNPNTAKPVSKCAQQLQEIASCNTPEMMENAFGGFDRIIAGRGTFSDETVFYFDKNGQYNGEPLEGPANITYNHKKYGLLDDVATENITTIDITTNQANGTTNARVLSHHEPRPTGVATEIYNQIVDTLATQCTNLQGRFVELQFIKQGLYQESNLCLSNFNDSIEYGGTGGGGAGTAETPNLVNLYGIGQGEDMCPRQYNLDVDTQSWGACLCWENGGRRSKWGKSPKCIAGVPTSTAMNDAKCTSSTVPTSTSATAPENWCTLDLNSSRQVCPYDSTEEEGMCKTSGELLLHNLPDAVI